LARSSSAVRSAGGFSRAYGRAHRKGYRKERAPIVCPGSYIGDLDNGVHYMTPALRLFATEKRTAYPYLIPTSLGLTQACVASASVSTEHRLDPATRKPSWAAGYLAADGWLGAANITTRSRTPPWPNAGTAPATRTMFRRLETRSRWLRVAITDQA